MGRGRARSHARTSDDLHSGWFTGTANVNFVFADILGHVRRTGKGGDGSVMYPCKRSVVDFFVIKPTRCTNFTIYFVIKLYMFRTARLSIIRSLFTIHSAMVYVIQVCRQLSSRSICIVTDFFVIKPTRCTNFTNLFCHETLHVSDSSTVRNM